MVLYDGANRRVFVVVEGEVRLGCPIPSIAVLSCRLVVVEQRSHHRATVETLQHCTEIVQDDADDVIQIRRAFRYARNRCIHLACELGQISFSRRASFLRSAASPPACAAPATSASTSTRSATFSARARPSSKPLATLIWIRELPTPLKVVRRERSSSSSFVSITPYPLPATSAKLTRNEMGPGGSPEYAASRTGAARRSQVHSNFQCSNTESLGASSGVAI